MSQSDSVESEGDESGLHRQRDHEEMEPTDWFDVLEGGAVAVYFELVADHEWWLLHDPDGEYPGDLDGPWHLWSTYPSGPWNHTALPRGIFKTHLEEVYRINNRNEDSDIRRNQVVDVEDAPRFVQEVATRQECYVVDCENPADEEVYSHTLLKTYGVCEEHESEVRLE